MKIQINRTVRRMFPRNETALACVQLESDYLKFKNIPTIYVPTGTKLLIYLFVEYTKENNEYNRTLLIEQTTIMLSLFYEASKSVHRNATIINPYFMLCLDNFGDQETLQNFQSYKKFLKSNSGIFGGFLR